MPGRSDVSESYRYGFNGMEGDNEVKGDGNSYTTEFRQYAPRIGRWLSIDPLMAKAPGWTPYRFGFDNPVIYTDQNGLYETKREARQARRGAMDHGYAYGEIRGRKGHYYFQTYHKDDKGATVRVFVNKKMKINKGRYKGGVELFEAVEARDGRPYAESKLSYRFNVGEYTVVPYYNGGKLEYYTASIEVTDPSTMQKTTRFDYIIGRESLEQFEENINTYEAAANLAFGASVHLSESTINLANGEYWRAFTSYIKEQWTDPLNLINLIPGKPSVGIKVRIKHKPGFTSRTYFNKHTKGMFNKENYGSNWRKVREDYYKQWTSSDIVIPIPKPDSKNE